MKELSSIEIEIFFKGDLDKDLMEIRSLFMRDLGSLFMDTMPPIREIEISLNGDTWSPLIGSRTFAVTLTFRLSQSQFLVRRSSGARITYKMFLKVQLPWNIIIPAESLESNGLMLQRSMILRLLDDFASKKASKELGYYLAVTTLDKIGEGKVRQNTGDVLFPVRFSGITFKIFRGEIIEGVVHKVLKHGVFLRCGPIENIYLSNMKMPDYRYVPGEDPEFMNDKLSKIKKDVVVRVIVLGTKWLEAEREFQALVSLEGDYLGPVS
ncbi:hypothetical protein LWI29_015389 [Acer saccharum]|uniref:DNA-directed RNA polymerase subunit n=1 Tax=Acer saccharum TaxID=4024 RepID=A0AA39TKS9_ACESA|nr:hypothetical protein LWI29_015389 [Acer saccharum]